MNVDAVLVGCSAGNREAEKLLSDWEAGCGECGPWEGYVDELRRIVSSPRAEPRLMACICLKNIIKRKWRAVRGRNASGAVSECEKSRLRQWLVTAVAEEEDSLVLAQLVECCRGLARADWPRAWPSALFDFVGSRALCIVVKELSTKRLPGDRKAFDRDAADLFPKILAGDADAERLEVLGIIASRSTLDQSLLDSFFEMCRRGLYDDNMARASAEACAKAAGPRHLPVLGAAAAESCLSSFDPLSRAARLDVVLAALEKNLLPTALLPNLADFCFERLSTSVEELEEWNIDPEDYVLRDEYEEDDPTENAADAARTLRLKCENVLLALESLGASQTVRDVAFGPRTERRLADVCSSEEEDLVNAALIVDGALRGAGILAFAIEIDFASWCLRVALPALGALRSSRHILHHSLLRRRLYWLMRCFAPTEISESICESAAKDCSDREGDVAVRLQALDALDAFFFAGGQNAYAVARAALSLVPDLRHAEHVAKAFKVGTKCARTMRKSEHASAIARDLLAIMPSQRQSPAALSALADAARVAVRLDVSAVVDRASSLVDALLDAESDPELCCGPSACDLWLDLLRYGGDSPLLRRLGTTRLAPLCSPPRDLALAVHCARIATALSALDWPLDVEGALGPLVAQVGERANGDVDSALELVASKGRASPDFLFGVVAPGLLADIRGEAGTTAKQHLAVLCRIALVDPRRMDVSFIDELSRDARRYPTKLDAVAALALLVVHPSPATHLDAVLSLVAAAAISGEADVAGGDARAPVPVGSDEYDDTPDRDESAIVADDNPPGISSREEEEVVPLDKVFVRLATTEDRVRAMELRGCVSEALNAIAARHHHGVVVESLSATDPSILRTLQLDNYLSSS